MKTPETIKKGLEYLSITDIAEKVKRFEQGVPYAYAEDVAADALAYIQQLEAKNNAMYNTILSVMHFVNKWLDCPDYDPDKDLNGVDAVKRTVQAREIALKAIEKLEEERYRMIDIIRLYGGCEFCMHVECDMEEEPCLYCMDNERWEWRGVQKE